MSTSVLTKKQTKVFHYQPKNVHPDEWLTVTVRYDDQCGNGHNTFSITATGQGRCGCLHDEIAEKLPELAHLIKWHLCSSDGPMHYIANTLYHVSDKDCWGLRKGETRQLRNGKTGELCWILEADKELPKYAHGDNPPDETATLRYVPWNRIGEGKARELDYARSSAIWPDATDEELLADNLEERLKARLPKLMEEFRLVVESLGFVF